MNSWLLKLLSRDMKTKTKNIKKQKYIHSPLSWVSEVRLHIMSIMVKHLTCNIHRATGAIFQKKLNGILKMLAVICMSSAC